MDVQKMSWIDRKLPPPADLVDCPWEPCHKDVGISRPAKAARVKNGKLFEEPMTMLLNPIDLRKKLRNIDLGDILVLKDIKDAESSAPAMFARVTNFDDTKSTIEITGGLRFSTDNFKISDDNFEFLERFGHLQVADVIKRGGLSICN